MVKVTVGFPHHYFVIPCKHFSQKTDKKITLKSQSKNIEQQLWLIKATKSSYKSLGLIKATSAYFFTFSKHRNKFSLIRRPTWPFKKQLKPIFLLFVYGCIFTIFPPINIVRSCCCAKCIFSLPNWYCILSRLSWIKSYINKRRSKL